MCKLEFVEGNIEDWKLWIVEYMILFMFCILLRFRGYFERLSVEFLVILNYDYMIDFRVINLWN